MNKNVTHSTEKKERLVTEKEAAQEYRLSSVTLYRARESKKLKFYRIGRRILYSEKHLQDFLAACEQN